MLEHVPPPYLESYSMSYRDICMSITIITNPIVNTLQALSVWLIVAFSIHRSRSIVRTGSCMNPIKTSLIEIKNNLFDYLSMRLKCKSDEENNTFYFFKNKFKITFNDNCGCFCCVFKHKDSNNRIELMELSNNKCSKRLNNDKISPPKYKSKKINKVPIIIIVLYLFGLVYFIPQMFEKKLSSMEIQGKVYKFVTITDFGQTRIFRQIFHLWFYLFAIYVIPFVLIFVSNFLLLKTYLKSKRRCSQYQLSGVSASAKIAAASITARNSNDLITNHNSNNHLNILNENYNTTFKESCSMVTFNQEESVMNTIRNSKLNTSNLKINSSTSSINLNYKNNNFTNDNNNNRRKLITTNRKRRPSLLSQVKTFKLNKRSKSLTITLFGVSAIFFVCHFPAAITKIIYVLFPEIEFEDKSALASLFLDVSNFLLILNSSINFLLYIVLGPGKFRQEFSMIFLNCCSCLNKKETIQDQDIVHKKKRSLSFSVTLNNLNASVGGYESDNQSFCLSANNNRRNSNVSFMDANKMSSNSHSINVLKEEFIV